MQEAAGSEPGCQPPAASRQLRIDMPVVTVLYYLLVAFVAGLLLYNLARSKSWERDVLYVIVLVPFLLRLFRLK
jgi:hypothetical protein